MRSVVVTGSSTGIGYAACQALLERNYRVFGSVRTASDADRLATHFKSNFTPLLFDVTDEAAIRQAATQVAAALNGETLAGLVNNAGIAVAGPLIHLPIADFRHQLDVNLTGQLMVTQAFAPLLGVDRSLAGTPGRIVMISSVSGRAGSPFVGPYAASKFGLEGLSESLRRELMLYGIDVVIVGPGPVATPIWEKANKVDTSPYAATDYAEALVAVKDYMLTVGRAGVAPQTVGVLVADILSAARPRTRYAVTASRIENLAMQVIPKRWLDRIMARRLGLLPKR